MRALVIGSTGTVGGWVAQGLAARGVSVRCMSRSGQKMRNLPEGIEGIVADLDRPHTLPEAFKNVDSVFLVTPVGRTETEQGLHAVSAARSAGAAKLVYLSVFLPPGSDVIPHFRSKVPVEDAVQASGMAYTILRPNNFFQNDLSLIGIIMGYGIYPTPVGKIGLNRIDARDVGEAAVNALLDEDHNGQVYALHGPQALTGRDMARIYSKYVGRDVRYAGDNIDTWVRHVKNVMPDWLWGDLTIMYRYFQDRGMIAPEADLDRQERLLGHPPRSFDDFARQLSGEWKQSLACAA
jgi:uncharacterized protein YbjT (DUF2867 family)